MNIKQAEQLSGVSKRNIRYYEQEGLLSPTRNRENDYREYTAEDITTLKRIRILRSVDMPLEQIRQVLHGNMDLATAAAAQKERLRQQTLELEAAILFCEEFSTHPTFDSMDEDEVLARMEAPACSRSLFQQWAEDYRKIAASEHEKTFTFTPETPVTTPAEFTWALCQYGHDHDLNLIVTKEGMYPEFTIDGIDYTAERFYTRQCRIPVAVIRCTVKREEDFDVDVSEPRKKLLTYLHHHWLMIPFLLFVVFICWPLLGSWEGWVVLGSVASVCIASLYRFNMFYYNHDGKDQKSKPSKE